MEKKLEESMETNMGNMAKKLEESMETNMGNMEKKMEKLEESMERIVNLIQNPEENIPNDYNVGQGTHDESEDMPFRVSQLKKRFKGMVRTL